MKRLRAALFAVLTVSVLSIGAMSAQAGTSSGPGARPAAAWAGPSAGDVIKRPDGVAVTLPMDWAKMTVADLAGIGIVPGMGPNKAVSSYQPTSGVRPASAYGCDGWVCIQLIGNGRLISNWYTSADTQAATGAPSRPTGTQRPMFTTPAPAFVAGHRVSSVAT